MLNESVAVASYPREIQCCEVRLVSEREFFRFDCGDATMWMRM